MGLIEGDSTGGQDHERVGVIFGMMLAVSNLVGLSGLPTGQRGLHDWQKRRTGPVQQVGKRFVFSLRDLPKDIQLAYRLEPTEQSGLAFGEQDDAAHLALTEKPDVRQRAMTRSDQTLPEFGGNCQTC